MPLGKFKEHVEDERIRRLREQPLEARNGTLSKGQQCHWTPERKSYLQDLLKVPCSELLHPRDVAAKTPDDHSPE